MINSSGTLRRRSSGLMGGVGVYLEVALDLLL